MAYKTRKNLATSRDQYNAQYGAFRGVDFASDHTEVNNSRFPYAVNVYKDYQSGQGTAVETIPGFRRRLSFEDDRSEIRGIYPFDADLGADNYEPMILIHKGQNLVLATKKPKAQGTSETSEKELYSDDYVQGMQNQSGETIFTGILNDEMGTKSSSFKYGKYIYVLANATGTTEAQYLRIDMTNPKKAENLFDLSKNLGYVPTVRQGGEDFEQGNILSAYAKDAIVITDANQKEYEIPWGDYSAEGDPPDVTVELYGTPYTLETGVFQLLSKNGKIIGIKFSDKIFPNLPEDAGYPSGYAGLVVKYPKKSGFVKTDSEGNKTVVNPLKNCTITSVFDNRVFFAGNPDYPNMVFWSALDDPTYFGELNFETLGLSNEPISALMPVANSLCVLKRYADQEGAVFYLTPQLVDSDTFAKAYSKEHGLNGTGCLGAATSFMDDPVFISSLGLEAIGTLNLRYERAIEHRSSLVDPLLVKCDLSSAKMVCWNGWLFILCDGGKAFLADSRQLYTHPLTKTTQYEWFYLEGIGEYIGQTLNNPDDPESYKTEYSDGEYYGGKFHPASAIAVIDNNIFFGTTGGNLFSFNFDKRNEYGEIPSNAYSFDGRRYLSGVATKMDNVGIPHLTKTTVKKSVVAKFKSMLHSAATVKVRTDKTPYTKIDRISSAIFDFDDLNFDDVVFSPSNTPITLVSEREKRWVEKQYYIFSNEFEKPFSLIYLAYRYVVSGRYKE